MAQSESKPRLVQLISSSDPGSYIPLAMFNTWGQEWTAAVENLQRRGVDAVTEDDVIQLYM